MHALKRLALPRMSYSSEIANACGSASPFRVCCVKEAKKNKWFHGHPEELGLKIEAHATNYAHELH